MFRWQWYFYLNWLGALKSFKNMYRTRSFGKYFLGWSAPMIIGGHLWFCILNSVVHSRCKKQDKKLTQCSESMHKDFAHDYTTIIFCLIKSSPLAVVGHRGFCILKANVYLKRKIHIRNWPRALLTWQKHVSHKIIQQIYSYPWFTASKMASILDFATQDAFET